MSKRLSFMAPALLALHLVATPVGAEDAPGADTIVATVNGVEITLGHMLQVRTSLPSDYQNYPDETLFSGILDQLISQTLLQQSFTGAEPRQVRLALENERRSLVAAQAIQKELDETMTEAAVQAAYKERYSGDLGTEYNASHILVKTKEEANALVSELQGGADFAALAKTHSTGPSGPSGGDLGWFGTGRMVPEFEAAVIALEVGANSAPVETQFGWHVIQLRDTRILSAPTLDSVRQQIENELQSQMIAARIEALKAKAVIDRSAETTIDPAIIRDLSLLED